VSGCKDTRQQVNKIVIGKRQWKRREKGRSAASGVQLL